MIRIAPTPSTTHPAQLWLLAFCVLFAMSYRAHAQTSATDGTTPLSLSPGTPAGSYALSGFDNVNLFNGNLNFHLQLLHIGGRGEAQYTMMLPIETHWRVLNRSNDYQEIWLPTDSTWYGDKPGYGPGMLEERAAALSTSGVWRVARTTPLPINR